MILRFDHDTGAGIETPIAYRGELPPVEIARGVLAVLDRVTRVRVWEDGRSPVSDPPSADVVRTRGDGPVLVDEDTREAREVLREWLADSLCGTLDDLTTEETAPPPRTVVPPGEVAAAERQPDSSASPGFVFQGPV
ncbi:hypothetical protein [Pseudofrankia sp. BMG5.36]|uniref:hypothetical protein n=1 Tax=Pseudofrankia sp. BMG5.36 TaxID=1834512 RepID=UPI0008D92D5E|nr:hypothetical protein [Pseudofrankia sp. BMG5.36]OHV56497.1 hypothetical protein BCD48_08525 [Pseudofrankia sp. BMG5.36]